MDDSHEHSNTQRRSQSALAARDLKHEREDDSVLCWTKDSGGGDFNLTVQNFAVDFVKESLEGVRTSREARMIG